MILLPNQLLDQHGAPLSLLMMLRGSLLCLRGVPLQLLSRLLLLVLATSTDVQRALGHAVFFAFSALHLESVLEVVEEEGGRHTARVGTAWHW